MPTRRDYSRRPKAAFLPFPAVILDPAVLDELGVIAGTRPDEDPPKVVMTLADWRRVAAQPTLARKGIRFLSTKREENPLKGGLPSEDETPVAAKVARPKRPRKPGPFDHLRDLPLGVALERAKAEHESRMAAGMSSEDSMVTYLAALERARDREVNRVIPSPLPAMEGDDPPTPTEVKRNARLARIHEEIQAALQGQPSRHPKGPKPRPTPQPKRPRVRVEVPSPKERVAYPAEILDYAAMDDLRAIWGTVYDGPTPKVIMSRADWARLLAHPRREAVVRLLGSTAEDNPLVAAS